MFSKINMKAAMRNTPHLCTNMAGKKTKYYGGEKGSLVYMQAIYIINLNLQ